MRLVNRKEVGSLAEGGGDRSLWLNVCGGVRRFHFWIEPADLLTGRPSMPPSYVIKVPISYALNVPGILQINDATADVDVLYPDRSRRVENATLVSYKVPIGTLTHGVPGSSIWGHFTLVYDYDAETNTILIYERKSHITSIYEDETCHVYTDGECFCDGENWAICAAVFDPILQMFRLAAQNSENLVYHFMQESPAGYKVELR